MMETPVWLAFEGLVDVKLDNAGSASRGDFIYSSTTAGSGHADGDLDNNGMVGVVASIEGAGSGYVGMVFNAQNKVTADMYLNVGFDSNAYKDIYTLLASEYNAMSEAERRGLLEEGMSQSIMFDNFVDGLKADPNLTTLGVDYLNNRAGLWGGDTINGSALDIDGNRYLGSSSATVEAAYYYDRSQTGEQGQDSSPEVLSDIGVDPNWYKGVSLQTACTTNCLANSNLSPDYNGSLFKVTGTYGVSSEHGSVDIKIVESSVGGIKADISSSDGSCSVSSATLSYGNEYSFNAGSCSGSSIKIKPLRAEYNSGDTFRVASWLLEPETADDRGVKREFPEHSLIIGSKDSSDRYLTIVDADTQRVWMKFASSSGAFASGDMLVDNASHSIDSVFVNNGKLYLGSHDGTAGGAGAFVIDFVRDQSDALYVGGTYRYEGSVGERQEASTYILNSDVGIIDNEVYDVHANVVPNQVTQEVTVSGWGYIQGDGSSGPIAETVTLPYTFNDEPIVSVSNAYGKSSSAPKSLSECTVNLANTFVGTKELTDKDFTVRMFKDGDTMSTSTYYCYTWEATGTVSPRTYSAWATEDGSTMVNHSEKVSVNQTQDSYDTDAYVDEEIWLTTKGDLYKAVYDDDDGSGNGLAVLYSPFNEGNLSDQDDSIDYILNEHTPGVIADESYIRDFYVQEDRSSLDWPNNKVYLAISSGAFEFKEDRESIDVELSLFSNNDDRNGVLKKYTNDYISESLVGDNVLMWPLNLDNASSDYEDIGGGNHGLYGSPGISSADAVSGVRGTGVDLDGSSEYFNILDHNDLSFSDNTMSGSFWMKKDGDPSVSEWILMKGAYGWEYSARLLTTGVVNVKLYVSGGGTIASVESSTSVTDNQWHHVVFTSDGDTLSIYIDGELSNTTTSFSGTMSNTEANFEIGYNSASSGYEYEGYLDEIMLTSRCLEEGLIKSMYDTGRRALDGSHSVSDSYNKLNGTSDNIYSIMVTPDGRYMYLGSLSGVYKVDLRSDTLVDTYTTSTSPGLSSDYAEIIAGRHNLRFVSTSSSGRILGMSADNEADDGDYTSEVVTFDKNSNKAYLWMHAYIDPDDSSAGISVSASNDGGSTYVSGSLIKTNTNGDLPEYEYSFDFPSSGNEYIVKMNMLRGSGLNSATYITDWALAQMDINSGSGNGLYSEEGTSVASGSYLDVVHGQGTYNLIAKGWVYNTDTSKWMEVNNTDSTVIHSLAKDWVDADANGVIRATVGNSGIGISSFLGDGGTVTQVEESGTVYRIHKFTTSGVFDVVKDGTVEVLLVGGGGGGAATGSGGGAGGYVHQTEFEVGAGEYNIVVGAGGDGGVYPTSASGSNGGNSSFSTLTAYGGGQGITHGNTSPVSGGCGGGGAVVPSGSASAGGVGSQGGDGGDGYVDAGWAGTNGGGGGAGGDGADAGNTSGSGNGGVGLANDITGTSIYYAGGGGGGEVNGTYVGTGGNGGGGTAVVSGAGGDGTDGLGGGGAGGSFDGTYYDGGDGGSGVVIIRYAVSDLTYPYGMYVSDEIPTLDAQTYGDMFWDEELNTNGNIGIETRSGGHETRAYGMDFDGIGDTLSTSSSDYDFTTEDFTVSMWLKPTLSQKAIFFGNGDYMDYGYYAFLYEDGHMAFSTHQSGAQQVSSSTVGSVTANEWQYITIVRDSSTVTFYRNGVDVTNSHGTHVDPTTSPRDFLLGTYGPSPDVWYYSGQMDEVRIWEDALSSTEIQTNMDINELTGSETNLVGYWQMNEMEGTTTDDASSSNNDLTISNASWREFHDWEEWKPLGTDTESITLADCDDDTEWTDTSATAAEGDVVRNVDLFEDEDEDTAGNILKMTSSTNGGAIYDTISSTDISDYDYLSAWVRNSHTGTRLRLQVEDGANYTYKDIIIDAADTWQKVYFDITDVEDSDLDAVTVVKLVHLTTDSTTSYIDNIKAEKVIADNGGSQINSTPNDFLQYRTIFTTTNTANQPELESIGFAYQTGYEIEMVDSNTVRLHNNTGATKRLRLDVILGGAMIDLQSNTTSGVLLAPALAQVDSENNTNSIWINKTGTGGNLLKLQTMGTDMFVVDSAGNLDMEGDITMAGDIEITGGEINLGSSGDQGSIRYNETDDVLEFTNDGINWIAMGGATSMVSISAEYPGGTLVADGSSNVGAMTSDAEGTSANSMNYYEWNSSEVSLNDYDVRVRFTLPSDFDSWGSGGITLNYATESTSSSSNQIDFYVYEETSATVDASSEDLASSGAGTWTTSTISGTSLTDCDTAGEVCVLILRMSSANDNYARIGDIEFNYNRSL